MTGWIEHVAGPNERWDRIAYRYYGDANRTQALIRANRDLYPPLQPIPLIIPAGTVLRVPILDPEPVAQDLLPPWKRSQS